MSYPKDLKYSPDHEWLRVEGQEAVIGITGFAVEQLGDVVYVELPQVGAMITAGEPFGTVESVKSVSDLLAPMDGEVIAVNQQLGPAPEKVNESPYHEGWMIRIRLIPNRDTTDHLMNAEAYLNSLPV